jgi:YgiT-type zinc finger domain-containing protein
MRSAIVQTAIWHDERLFVVEDVPAYVCDSCMEQFYDDEITDAIRRLTEDGFPAVEAKREILVPVFSLSGRLLPKRPVVEEWEGWQVIP